MLNTQMLASRFGQVVVLESQEAQETCDNSDIFEVDLNLLDVPCYFHGSIFRAERIVFSHFYPDVNNK